MTIDLYSVKGFTGSALRKKLEEQLEELHLPYTINEINHVDQFIKAGLSSVPAFRIGEQIIKHPSNGVPDETIQTVINYILAEKINMILVPVDFSDESNHAISYAMMMAKQLNLGVILAHIHQTIYDPISAGALDVQFLQDSNKRLTDLVEKVKADNATKGIEVPVRAHLEVGGASTSLIELLDHGQFDMMIMGTKATDNTVRRLFGSVSSDVSIGSSKPVIVIPPNTEIKFPGKMVVGFTEELMLNNTLEYILAFGAKNNVFFDFVQITDDHEAFNVLKDKLYQRLVAHRSLVSGFTICSLHEEDQKVHEILFDYAHQAHAGMVILVSHHRSFIENIRHSSVTRKALQHPIVPLMIIHHPVND